MFYIIEIQETSGETPAITTQTQDEKNKALSVFHTILGYVALSEVEHHTVLVVTETGQYIARETFEHPKPVEILEEEASADA